MPKFNQILKSETEMSLLANRLANHFSELAPHDKLLIFLTGNLGAGKTTFTRGVLRGLGYTEKVKSPTYTIVESYCVNNRSLFHFDFYRLHDPSELQEIGLQEYLSFPSAICIIEWPEKGFPLLPQPDLACYIDFNEQGREFGMDAHSDCGNKLLAGMMS